MKTPRPRALVNARRTLERWGEGGDVARSDVVVFFHDIRKGMEALGNSSRFPDLKTYCDWTNHVLLDRKNHLHVLRSVTEFLDRPGTDAADTLANFSSYFANSQLIFQQIVQLLGQGGISVSVSIPIATIRSVIYWMLDEICDHPLQLPERYTDNFEDAQKALGTSAAWIVTKVEVHHTDKDSVPFEFTAWFMTSTHGNQNICLSQRVQIQ